MPLQRIASYNHGTLIIIIIIIILIVTLFRCQVYLALRHTNWGHCQLKLIQIKFNQMHFFEERVKMEYPGGKTSQSREENQQTQPTYEAKSGNQTQATLVQRE